VTLPSEKVILVVLVGVGLPLKGDQPIRKVRGQTRKKVSQPLPHVDRVESEDPELTLLGEVDTLVPQETGRLVCRVNDDKRPEGNRGDGEKPRHKAGENP
jgi:hypothetical protein